MTFSEWRKLFFIETKIRIPEFYLFLMCPYVGVGFLWYTAGKKEFEAWPNKRDTGLLFTWRWPFREQFKERVWYWQRAELPLALYGAMDQSYVERAMRELGWTKNDDGKRFNPYTGVKYTQYISAAVREMKKIEPKCAHNYWIANCPDCARRSMTLAVFLMSQAKPQSVPDPNESPLAAFQRREAEAQRRLAAGEPL